MLEDFWRWYRLWQLMNNDTKCCTWLRRRRKGPKQSRGKFACYKITSEAGRFQGASVAPDASEQWSHTAFRFESSSLRVTMRSLPCSRQTLPYRIMEEL